MRLKELRKNENLYQEDIAKILNTTQATYSRYEQGISEAPIDVLCKLADYYHVTVDYLIGRDSSTDFGFISSEQQKILKKIASLSENNQIKVAGYVDSLIESEKK